MLEEFLKKDHDYISTWLGNTDVAIGKHLIWFGGQIHTPTPAKTSRNLTITECLYIHVSLHAYRFLHRCIQKFKRPNLAEVRNRGEYERFLINM